MATRNTTNGKKMTIAGRLGGAANHPQRPGGLGKTPGRTPSGVPTMGGKLPTGTAVKTPKGNGPSGIWITRGKKK